MSYYFSNSDTDGKILDDIRHLLYYLIKSDADKPENNYLAGMLLAFQMQRMEED